jgi:hypothetical protein
MRKHVLTRIVLIVLAVAAVSFVLYKCSGGFKEGIDDAREHRDAKAYNQRHKDVQMTQRETDH